MAEPSVSLAAAAHEAARIGWHLETNEDEQLIAGNPRELEFYVFLEVEEKWMNMATGLQRKYLKVL